MSLADEKYISFATFRRSGAAVATPTWIVPLDDGRIGFWSSSSSGKVKRLRNNPQVTVQPSDVRGRPKDSAVRKGTATVVTGGPEFDTVQQRVKAKYGVMVPISRFFNTVGHLGKGPFPYGDVVIVVAVEA